MFERISAWLRKKKKPEIEEVAPGHLQESLSFAAEKVPSTLGGKREGFNTIHTIPGQGPQPNRGAASQYGQDNIQYNKFGPGPQHFVEGNYYEGKNMNFQGIPPLPGRGK